MFQKLRYVGTEPDWSAYDIFVYEVIDDLFQQSFRVRSRSRPNIVHGIAEIYQSRNLNVAKNVSLYYMSGFWRNPALTVDVQALANEIASDMQYIDAMYPKMNYGKTYYNCIKRHINSCLWTKGLLKC